MSSSGTKPVHRSLRGDDRRGTKIGKYRLEDAIGEGGMGVVYRAVDEGSAAVVALKLLAPEHVGNEVRRKRFLREARVTMSLDHPSIARVIEVGDDAGVLFIAMELVRGRTVRARIDAAKQGETLSIATARGIARSIAEAAAYAHAKGIVHRDLKPDNVMLAEDGTVRVLDFGLAKLRETEGALLYEAETETSMTHEGHVLGTPAYMAPEQATGKEVSFRADVFSLGTVLYEMLTLERPFNGASTVEIIAALTRDDPAAPKTKNKDVPESLNELVLGCLSKSAAERPTMESVASALATGDGRASDVPVSRATSRRPWLALAAIAAVSAAGAYGWQSSRSTSIPTSTASSTPAPTSVPTSIVDLPAPVSSVPAAITVYQDALKELRAGDNDTAEVNLEKATELDPNLAAAQLRVALRASWSAAEVARKHFAAATKSASSLSPRDAALLDAYRPIFQRDPPDLESWAKAMTKLAQDFPADAEIATDEAAMHNMMGDFAGAKAADERAIAIDPKYASAYSDLAEVLAYLGDDEGAYRTVARCLDVSSGGQWCLRLRDALDTENGRCASLEASARDGIAIDPTIAQAYRLMILALAAENKPESSIREALALALARLHEGVAKQRFAANQGSSIDALFGDFTNATEEAAIVRRIDEPLADVSYHAFWADVSGQLYEEMGLPDESVKLAGAFLEKRAAWQNQPLFHDYTLSDDRTPILLTRVHRAHKMSDADYESSLAAWRARWDAGLRGQYRPYLWVYGYAPLVETEADARNALAAAPKYAPIPPFVPNGDVPLAFVGRVLALGGQRDEGIAYLSRASAACHAGNRPVTWIHAHAWLGDALVARGNDGDKERACTAYNVVLSHWGHAKPRSITAEHVKKAAAAIDCEGAR